MQTKKSLKIAFVCGPYFDSSEYVIQNNIARAKACAIWLWNNNFYVICPHTNTGGFHSHTSVSEEVFRVFYKTLIERVVDLVVLYEDSLRIFASTGTTEEIGLARELNIPVYVWRGTYLEPLEY